MCLSSCCMICGGPVPPDRWVCRECAELWGLGGPYRNWPSWAKYLQRTERQQRAVERVEVLSLDVDGDPPRVQAEPTDALLEYAPYQDEAANRDYRKACGIEERECDVPSSVPGDPVCDQSLRRPPGDADSA